MKEKFHFRWGPLQIFDVFTKRFDLVDGHASFDTAVDGARFVLGKVVAGLGAKQYEDLL
jgi:hypothetical protein